MRSQKHVSGNQPLGSKKILAPEENACTALAHMHMQTAPFLKKMREKIFVTSSSVSCDHFWGDILSWFLWKVGTKGVMGRGEKARTLRSFPSSPSRASHLSPALACSTLSLGRPVEETVTLLHEYNYKICTCSFLQYHPWCFLPSQQ